MKRILIVDDSPLVHELYGAQLKEAGFEVLHANDGVSAINSAFNEMPDLILLDVYMPQINGYQVCRLLKDHPITREIPIIITTAQSNQGFVKDPKKWSFQTGANGYFDKGSSDSLVSLLTSFIDKTPASHPQRRQYPPISETEIMGALSQLLDKQLYADVTRLKELDERKNAFVGNVSHELKSPLGVIKGYLENTIDDIYGPLSDKQKEILGKCVRNIDRLSRLIIDLLDLSKIEAGRMTLKKDSLRIEEIMDETLATYNDAMEKKQLALVKKVTPPLPTLTGDRDRLIQLIVNLLSNSIKFTPNKGRITVCLCQEGPNIRLEIQDTGPGISPENLEKIFDKFERVASDKEEGTGLGLPIARDIATLHGGKLWAESTEGKGSKFILLLPTGLASPATVLDQPALRAANG